MKRDGESISKLEEHSVFAGAKLPSFVGESISKSEEHSVFAGASDGLEPSCSESNVCNEPVAIGQLIVLAGEAILAWCLRAWSGFGGCVWFFGFLCELIFLGLVLVFPETPRSLGRAPVWSPALREVTPASELCALRLFSKTGLGP